MQISLPNVADQQPLWIVDSKQGSGPAPLDIIYAYFSGLNSHPHLKNLPSSFWRNSQEGNFRVPSLEWALIQHVTRRRVALKVVEAAYSLLPYPRFSLPLIPNLWLRSWCHHLPCTNSCRQAFFSNWEISINQEFRECFPFKVIPISYNKFKYVTN